MTEKSSTEKAPAEETLLSVKKNLTEIFSAVAGKNVTVMAATKTVPPAVINYAITECGLRNIGENRVQELNEKYDRLALDGVKVHFIGTLQPNKVKYLIGRVCLIHSLDSLKLAEEISRRSRSAGTVTDMLCEVNIGEEAAKGGVNESETEAFLRRVADFEGIRVRGLMVIGPHCENTEDYRPFFERTRDLYDSLKRKGFFGEAPILSMGMSDNYRLAVEYGATLIRPGSAIFGARKAVLPPS